MGIFDRFRRRRREAGEPGAGGDAELDDGDWEPDWSDAPVDAVALVREGHNVPTEQEMRAVLQREAPDCVELPKTGLNQMRWWQQRDWIDGGMRTIARAVRNTHGIDPDKTTWKVVKDDRGARVGIVFMRK